MIIYNDAYSEYHQYAIGHADKNGIIYSDAYSEYHQYAVGHVDKNGVIYSDAYSEYHQYAVGHVDKNGVIYSDAYSEYHQYAVGHVDKNGVIYSDPYSEYHQYAAGHVDEINFKLAAAAYLLLIYRNNGTHSTSSTHEQPQNPSGETRSGSSYSGGGSSGGSGGSSGGGGGGGILKILLIAAAVIALLVMALKGFVMSIFQFPAALVSIAIILIVGLANPDIRKRDIMDEVKVGASQEMKNRAMGLAALFSAVPAALWVVHAINNDERIFMVILIAGLVTSAITAFGVYRAYLYRIYAGKTPLKKDEKEKTNYFYASATYDASLPNGKVQFSCPFCQEKCVAPVSAGKIKIKCRNCSNYFYADTNRINARK